MRTLRASLLIFLVVSHGRAQAPDLYTIELYGTPELQRFSGVATLQPAASVFTAPVTPDGVHRFDVAIAVDSLPDPRSLGSYTTFIAWAVPPSMRPVTKIGELADNRVTGEVAFNRFTILVTAEANAGAKAPSDAYVLRGQSASMRLSAAHATPAQAPGEHHHSGNGWRMPPAHPRASDMYMPPLMALTPNAHPFLPTGNVAGMPVVKPRGILKLKDGDRIRLEAGIVQREFKGRRTLMYAFNGEHPGPLIDIARGATVAIQFVNRTALPAAIHWHGIRLDNRFDGVVHVTQAPVAPGDSFAYTVHFPDAGLYWYHPHHREDIQQDLGLYGNLLVREGKPGRREEILMLDDILFDDAGLIPYGEERATHALMGRFGNLMLVNGEPVPYRTRVRRNEVVRFYFTNVANTRTYNLSFTNARMKLVGGDIGKYQREEWLDNIVIAPAERYIVDVQFQHVGTSVLTNRVQAIDHTLKRFFPEVDTLAVVRVAASTIQSERMKLERNLDVTRDVAKYTKYFERAPDLTLTLTLKDRGLPFALVQQLSMDTLYFHPVEWAGTMPMMDILPTTDQVEWILRDEATGKENEEITRVFKAGEAVKIRFINDRHTLHAMAHPIHVHGQRFLILSVNGRATRNYVWKDTVLVPVGSTVDVLLDASNPGRWMLHCHIAEHLEAGMRTIFRVGP